MKENKSSKPETINNNKRIIQDNDLKREALEHETNQIEKIKVKLNSILNLLQQKDGSGLKVRTQTSNQTKNSGILQPKRQSYLIK